MRLRDLFGPQIVVIPCPAGWGTAATVSEVPAFVAPHDLKLTAVRFVPLTAVVGHATNNAVLSVNNRLLVGVGTGIMASKAYDTVTDDDVIAYDEDAVTLSATASLLLAAEGDVITIEKAVGGTGESIDGFMQLEYVSN